MFLRLCQDDEQSVTAFCFVTFLFIVFRVEDKIAPNIILCRSFLSEHFYKDNWSNLIIIIIFASSLKQTLLHSSSYITRQSLPVARVNKLSITCEEALNGTLIILFCTLPCHSHNKTSKSEGNKLFLNYRQHIIDQSQLVCRWIWMV
jgi:hypothetical protein